MKPQVVVIGLGYVGLPLAVALSGQGLRVIGFDINGERVAKLARGESSVEDVPTERLAEALQSGLRVTCNPEDTRDAHAYVICVPTPLSPSGSPDLSYVDAAVETVARVMSAGALVVLESTTYPGTTAERVGPRLEERTGLIAGSDFFLAFSPERIDPGNGQFSIGNTPKVVGADDPESLRRAVDLYETLGTQIVEAKGTREAELAKLLENTYRQVNIALVNEMSQFCFSLGIDIHDAIRCAATKPFGFQPFWPGPGVGGHCIPIDPSYLSFRVRAELGYPFRLIELAQEVNAGMPAYVVSRIQRALNDQGKAVMRSRICIFGVSYKPDVSDTRESPATSVIRQLWALGADVAYVDPFVNQFSVDGREVPRRVLDLLDVDEFDQLVVLQSHSQFPSFFAEARATNLLEMLSRYILLELTRDGRKRR